MKNLRIRKIITALIVITWVPSSFASPSGISARSSSYIYYYASPSSVASPSSIETPLSIVGIDGKNQINLNFITGSNGQLVIFEYCQDGSCKPLGLEEGYSLEMLEKFLEPWKKLSSDERFRELSEALEKKLLTESLMIDAENIILGVSRGQLAVLGAVPVGLIVAAIVMTVLNPLNVVVVAAGLVSGVAVGFASYPIFWSMTEARPSNRSDTETVQKVLFSEQSELKKITGQILEIIDSGRSLQILVEDNIIEELVTEIEKASEEDSKTLVPLPRD